MDTYVYISVCIYICIYTYGLPHIHCAAHSQIQEYMARILGPYHSTYLMRSTTEVVQTLGMDDWMAWFSGPQDSPKIEGLKGVTGRVIMAMPTKPKQKNVMCPKHKPSTLDRTP